MKLDNFSDRVARVNIGERVTFPDAPAPWDRFAYEVVRINRERTKIELKVLR